MRKVVLVVMAAGVCAVAGCAKKDMVKKEDVLPPVTQQVAPAMPAPVKAEQAPTAVPQPSKVAESVPPTPKVTPVEGGNLAASKEEAKPLGNVFFDFDSYLLSPEARQILAENAGILKKNPARKLIVEGHCDERGSDDYNLALGERRAKAALQYLRSLGIEDGRLSFISYGEEKPADAGHDEAAWARNRRDEFRIQE